MACRPIYIRVFDICTSLNQCNYSQDPMQLLYSLILGQDPPPASSAPLVLPQQDPQAHAPHVTSVNYPRRFLDP